MLSSLIDMARQKRPTGPLWTVDDAWKSDVLARMKEKGISRADLAHLISVSPASITLLFKPDTTQSRLVPKIHKALELVDTTAAVVAINKDEAWRRIQKVWRDLPAKEREHYLAIGELLAAKR